MYRLFGPTCIICQSRLMLKSSHASITSLHPQKLLSSAPWVSQSRNFARARSQRPARMELSQNVAKSRLSNENPNKERRRKGRDGISGPFAGMNRTKVTLPEKEPGRTRPATSWSKDSRSTERRDNKGPPREEYKALRMQQVLAHVGYGKRSRIKQQISSVTSFEGFQFLPLVKDSVVPSALPDLGDAVPTPIQRLAIPALLGRQGRSRSNKDEEFRQFLLAAETGSGKTLAYMTPVVDSIKRIELTETEEQQPSKKPQLPVIPENPDLYALEELAAGESKFPQGRPRAIILVPTSELVDQVGKVAKSLSHKVKFRACLISSAFSPTIIRNRLSSPGGIDLLITTPQLLSNIAKSNPAILSRVTHLVVDEADSLLDRSFEPFTTSIVERTMPTLRQLIMCSATIPRKMDNYLRKYYPDIVRLTTPNLHAIPRRVQLTVVDISKNNYFNNKDLACADTIWKIGKGSTEPSDESDDADNKGIKRIMVFLSH
jgi:ATP-dependent RNA helicase MRH4